MFSFQEKRVEMAQIKKKDIRKKILEAAKAIFSRDGFSKASLREITQQAEVTLSNLYNYYDDKDALFAGVLEPQVKDLLRLCEYGKTRLPGKTAFESLKEKQDYFLQAVNYIDLNRRELHLLFNLSAGSKLESFPKYLAKEYEATWDLYFDALRRQPQRHLYRKPSSFFLRSMAHFHLSTLRQILAENIARAEMKKISEELATFLWYGGMGLVTGEEASDIRSPIGQHSLGTDHRLHLKDQRHQ